MNSPDTQKRLSEIRSRCEKATSGPWTGKNFVKAGPFVVADCTYVVDTDFIAHSREDVPFLLDVSEEKDREIKNLNLALVVAKEVCDKQARALDLVREKLKCDVHLGHNLYGPCGSKKCIRCDTRIAIDEVLK